MKGVFARHTAFKLEEAENISKPGSGLHTLDNHVAHLHTHSQTVTCAEPRTALLCWTIDKAVWAFFVRNSLLFVDDYFCLRKIK
eukprot:scaffold615162_cov24-Prasinocladus_malaysianus.AAC.1